MATASIFVCCDGGFHIELVEEIPLPAFPALLFYKIAVGAPRFVVSCTVLESVVFGSRLDRFEAAFSLA